ncbi:type I secretion system permease/ATPase [Pelagivirga sediminicola]|uniref:Type I secretion system permease/ATPase n=1 Tax=Pelagivirga sediminicola TaxID=2170575 RepID=A0A2T7G4D4_9RHOB|nr:type I secretion system permease/ATPase [Pelagivirga sediminicola]PVA09246.1 type I secretion system permease/ATPase [Pelagivirga sediminicola]
MTEDAIIVSQDVPGKTVSVTDSGIIPALRHIARGFQLSFSEQAVRAAMDWQAQADAVEQLHEIAGRLGLELHAVRAEAQKIDPLHLPVLVLQPGADVLVVESISHADIATFWRFSGSLSDRNERPLAELIKKSSGVWFVRARRSLPDVRIDAYIAPVRKNWLRRVLFPSLRPYFTVIVASFLTNVLALAGILFSMQVYDRVIPAQSHHTLAVLFTGVAIAFLFEFFLKQSRSVLLDILGRNAGLRLSEQVFGRALRIRNDHRPKSTGSFIAQLRDIDTMREVLTSTSVGVLMDLPFFFLFCWLFWMIAGWLVLIPVAALAAIILPGLIMQPKLRSSARQAQREAALRNAILVETIQGIDDIKALQAEERFENIWRETSAATGEAQSQERRLVAGLTAWTQIVQQSVYAVTVAIGAPLVMIGEITTGTLVGASILGSRMIAPMSQISGVLSRLQQARVGAQGLTKIMKSPVDHPPDEARVTLSRITGQYSFENAEFSHRSDPPPALTVAHIQIGAGERIGVIGRNGAGKSTLLQAMAGQLMPSTGQLRLDGMSIDTIDPADLRRDIAYLSQNSNLFFGTLRDNLLLGKPSATDDELLTALSLAGGETFLSRFSKGWNYQIMEGGLGLSGGQKQTILLARLVLRNPSVLLLDEPTSAMDDTTERHFIEKLSIASGGRTLVVATHRHRILQLVDRLVVLDRGRIVLDGPRDQILAQMRGETK